MKRTLVKTDAAKRLIPLGALAIAAGCGGGAVHNALPAATDAAAPTQGTHSLTTATLTITIPARGASKSKRAPKYISQGSAAIGYTVAASGATPPAETVTALPSPGPVATTVTLPVIAPIGSDTVSVHVYDAVPSPGASATPNVLSEGSTTGTVVLGQTTTLNVAARGLAAGVQFSASRFEVFQNHPQPQSTTLTATPVDADGYAITGTLANTPMLAVPAGVSASPSAITAASSVTVTYPASSVTPINGIITAGLPLDTASGSTDNLAVGSTQYAFVVSDDGNANTTITAVDPVTQTVAGTVTYASGADGFGGAAVAGCASGETLISYDFNNGLTTGITFGVPSSANAATPTVTDLTGTLSSADSPAFLAADSNCGVYSAADATLTRYSGFPNAVGAPLAVTGWVGSGISVGVAGSTLYGTYDDTNNNDEITAQSVPLAGGTAVTVGPIGNGPDLGLLVGGAYVYDEFLDCSGSNLVERFTSLPDLTEYPDAVEDTSDAVAPNNTLYQFVAASNVATTAKHRAALRARVQKMYAQQHRAAAANAGRLRPSGTRRPFAVMPPAFVTVAGTSSGAITADGRYLVTGSDCINTQAVCTIQVYTTSASAGGAPTPIGAPISLPATQTRFERVFFPH